MYPLCLYLTLSYNISPNRVHLSLNSCSAVSNSLAISAIVLWNHPLLQGSHAFVMGTETVCNWQMMADPICCWHFQTLSSALLQPLWTACISNSLSLCLILPPHFPKRLLSSNNGLRIIICNSLMTCAAIKNIYNLWTETSPKIEMDPGYIPHLTSVQWVRKSIPSCSSCWCMRQPVLPLCQDTLTLLNIWQFTAKAGKSSKGFRTPEHPRGILEQEGYLLYDLTCLNWQSRKLSCVSTNWFIIYPTSFGTVR